MNSLNTIKKGIGPKAELKRLMTGKWPARVLASLCLECNFDTEIADR